MIAEIEKDRGISVDVERFKRLYRMLKVNAWNGQLTLDTLSLNGLP